jgi:hypothetical protein
MKRFLPSTSCKIATGTKPDERRLTALFREVPAPKRHKASNAAETLPDGGSDMKKILIGAMMVATGVAATPAMAQDHGRYSSYQDGGRYYDDGYRGDRRDYRDSRRDHRRYDRYDRYDRRAYRGDRRCKSGTGGAIIGGVLGALLGGEVGRGRYGGRSTTGTIVGAGAGALLGKEIAKGDCRRR